LLDGRLAGPVSHLCQLLLVGGELCVELGELDVKRLDASVDLGRQWVPRGGAALLLTVEMAEFSVGFGAVLFAPNRRFMAAVRRGVVGELGDLGESSVAEVCWVFVPGGAFVGG